MKQVPSRLDLLAADHPAAIRDAFDAIRTKTATQRTLLSKLNAVLVGEGIEPVSSSALNRWAMRVRAGEVRRPEGGGAAAPADIGALDATSRATVARALRSIADVLDPPPVAFPR